MRDLVEALARFDAAGPVARAVVLATWGSAPRPPGAVLLLAADGRVEGSVSGGCIENAVVAELEAARARGTPKRLRYEVSDETAWSVGLACGGTIEVLVEPTVALELRGAIRDVRGSVLVTKLDGSGRCRVLENDSMACAGTPEEVRKAALEVLRTERSVVMGDPELFFEAIPRSPELLIIGAGHVAQELVPLARRMGFRTTVFDARATFLTRERFPDADQMVQGWPAEELPKHLGPGSYVCVLSHDPKFDEPCVRLALRSAARYVGVIGSRKNQEQRRAALAAEGFSEDEIARLSGPIGLPLGGKQPNEIALSVMAELVQARYAQ